MIKIEGLTKVYRGTDYEVMALKGIDLHIKKGEFVAIMGESGSGKSTLLNCIGLMGIITDTAGKLGIEELLKKYPYQISGGQQQRVAIARAIVSNNPVILADEPTGALDSKTSEELMNYILLLRDMNKTIVMVTHDEKIAAYSDRVIQLCDGAVLGESG